MEASASKSTPAMDAFLSTPELLEALFLECDMSELITAPVLPPGNEEKSIASIATTGVVDDWLLDSLVFRRRAPGRKGESTVLGIRGVDILVGLLRCIIFIISFHLIRHQLSVIRPSQH
ncbi:hypothetical protein Micbo1qcDRAFT_208679 [Microdochium bolleyi]|uniref:Uncharacterized protein n=1 Tax=Microdochium bolleyi TaxID=196109 RepID=A0A136IPP8_9PEZI|nr:hypothetical protein Micbo1qcDRAFT_208679 [Microdochium bolleyi]